MALHPTSFALAALLSGGLAAACIEPSQSVVSPDITDQPDDGSTGNDGDTTTQPETTRPSCNPPLAVAPSELWLGPDQEALLEPSGGSGTYTLIASDDGVLSISDDAVVSHSGEIGTYEVTLTDSTCDGSASATVHVVTRPSLTPETASIPGDGVVRFQIGGGSGATSVTLLGDVGDSQCAGCAVDSSGVFTANGATEGSAATVEVRDSRTGLTATATVDISEESRLTAGPTTIFFAPGTSQRVITSGGVGDVEIALANPGSFDLNEGVVTHLGGEALGLIVVNDAHSDAEVTIDLVPTPPIAHATSRGPQSGLPKAVLHKADLDGDGYMDLIVGQPEATGGRARSGTVAIYRGSEAGLAASPTQRLEGAAVNGRLGTGLFVVDATGDGRADLLVGEPGADVGGLRGAGRVLLFQGLESGLLDSEPSEVAVGQQVGAELGTKVAVCDADGDARTDLIVTAPGAFDTENGRTTSGQGAVLLHFGVESNGWSSTPSVTRWALNPGDGASPPTTPLSGEIRLGLELAVGDLNGDGICDIAVAAPDASGPSETLSARLQVYLGRQKTVWDTGPEVPDVLGMNARGYGRALAIGDLDGDARDELVIGHPGWYLAPNLQGSPERGGVFIITGDTFAASEPQTVFDATPPIQLYGEASYDAFGVSVAIGDASGDGATDLVVGAWRAEDSALGDNNGVVTVHTFGAAGLATPSIDWRIEGDLEDHLGLAVMPMGRSGEASTDIATIAPYAEDHGLDTMSLYVVDKRGGTPRTRTLTLEDHPVPWRVGEAVTALPDLDGDGSPEFVFGAPDETVRAQNKASHLRFGGGLHLHRDPRVFPSTAAQDVGLFGGHDAQDRFGEATALLRDFNGDGISDLAVVARHDGWLGANGSSWQSDVDCNEARTSRAGSVLLFAAGSPASLGGSMLTSRPYAYLFNDTTGEGLTGVHDVGDVDGDDLSDLVATNPLAGANGAGVAHLWRGRSWNRSGDALATCAPEMSWSGSAFDGLGATVAPLGDITGDGCDEFALGVPGGGQAMSGEVRIVSIGGQRCTYTEARVRTIVPPVGTSFFGLGLASADIVGGSYRDLVIGAPGANGGGSAWVVRGDVLGGMFLSENTADQTIDVDIQSEVRIDADHPDVRLGAPVAVIEGDDDRAAIVVLGSEGDPLTDVSSSLHLNMYTITDDGATLVGRFVTGESAQRRTGRTTLSPWVLETGRGLLVGLSGSSQRSPDMGAVFPIFLDALDARLETDD